MISEAISRIAYPNKDAVWKHVVKLGYQHQRRFPGYKFIHRGGLSSPHVAYVTDIDFIFNNVHAGLVDSKDFDELQGLVEELVVPDGLISAKVARDNNDLFDEEIADFTEVRRYVEQGADLVVVTGRYELSSGWQVPMDFTLQRGSSKMTKEERIERILCNIEEKNFAKVISRARSLLSPEAKASFAGKWNAEGGALRFLVKQLDLVRFMSGREQGVYMTHLHLPSHPVPAQWGEAANRMMQVTALKLLRDSEGLLARVLGHAARDVFAAVDAELERASSETLDIAYDSDTRPDNLASSAKGTKGTTPNGQGKGQSSSSGRAGHGGGGKNRGSGKGKSGGHGKDSSIRGFGSGKGARRSFVGKGKGEVGEKCPW